MAKKWRMAVSNPTVANELSNSLGIHPIIAQLLVNREILTVKEAQLFLNADLPSLYNAFLLTDMDRAVERIEKAKELNERILIYGDYDVDGVTSSALLKRTLKRFGISAINYIPHRMEEGYGLNMSIVEFAQSQNIHLIITVDCGINAFEPIEAITKSGIDVIVIDHHELDADRIPNAVAVIDPKRSDCLYPFKHLSAVGLVAKLAQALLGSLPEEDLDLVALGTVADVVALRGENRIYVKKGLPFLERTTKHGLRALLDVAKISGKKMKPYYIGFVLGPRLNAAGRMDSANIALDLLLSEDDPTAIALANSLEEQNQKRQKTQITVVEEAIAMIEASDSLKSSQIIVVAKEGWHKGVLGIVASRIVEKYNRPTVVITLLDGLGTGSARSLEGFHLHEAFTSCSSMLDNFGGHKRAAGLRLKSANLDAFRDAINAFANSVMTKETLVPVLDIDCEISLGQIDMKLVEIIESMEPHGEGNPTPVFCTRQLMVKSVPALLGKDTIKFWVTDGNKTISAVGFGMGSYKEAVRLGSKVDLAYQLAIDDWNKAPTAQLVLKDIKLL